MTTIIIALVAIVAIILAFVAGDNTTTAATVDADIDSSATMNIVDDWGFPTECRTLIVAQTRALTVLPCRALVPTECRALVLAQESSQQAHNAAAYDIVMAQGVTATVSRTVNAEINDITDYTVKNVECVTLWLIRAARDIDIDITTIVRHAVMRNCDIVEIAVVKNCTLYKHVLLDNCHIHETVVVEGDVVFDNSRIVRGAVDGGGNTIIENITVKDSSYTVDVIDARPLTIDVETVVEPTAPASDLHRYLRVNEGGDVKVLGKWYRKGTATNIKIRGLWPYAGLLGIEIEKGYYPSLDDVEAFIIAFIKVNTDTFKTKNIRVDFYGGDCATRMSLDLYMRLEVADFTVEVGYLKPIA